MLAAITGRIADSGGNIDRIDRMARYPVTAIELHVSGVATDTLRTGLATEASRQGIDVAVQPESLLRRGRSEERRVGQECVRTCRYRWAPYHYKNNNITIRTKHT